MDVLKDEIRLVSSAHPDGHENPNSRHAETAPRVRSIDETYQAVRETQRPGFE